MNNHLMAYLGYRRWYWMLLVVALGVLFLGGTQNLWSEWDDNRIGVELLNTQITAALTLGRHTSMVSQVCGNLPTDCLAGDSWEKGRSISRPYAISLLVEGRSQDAERVLQNRLKQSVNPDVFDYFWLARALEATVRIEQSLACYREAGAGDYLVNRAKVKMDQGKFDEAASDYRMALAVLGFSEDELTPELADVYVELGHALGASGAKWDALEIYQAVVQAFPERADYRTILGMAYAGLGQFQEAEDELRRATKTTNRAGVVEAFFRLGEFYREQGRWQEAITAYQQGVALNPTHGFYRLGLAYAYLDAGMVAEAEREFKTVAEVNDRWGWSRQAYWELGRLYNQQGMLDEAIDVYERLLALAPDRAEYRIELGAAYIGKRKLARARDVLTPVLESDSSTSTQKAWAWALVGGSYRAEGDLARWVESYQRAVQLSPFNASYHIQLAQAYTAIGENTLAEQEYRTAQEIQGSSGGQ